MSEKRKADQKPAQSRLNKNFSLKIQTDSCNLKETVIVLDGALGAVLSLCRSAEAHGLQTVVVCIERNRCDIYGHSKYVSAVYYSAVDDLLHTFTEICTHCQVKGKPLLLFTADIYCMIVNKRRACFDRIVTLCMPSSEIIDGFCYKNKAGDMAKANGLTVPRTTCINDMQDVEKVADTFTFPVIIKPLSVEHGEQIGFKYKILNRNGFMQEDLWNSLSGNLLCQEYIPGSDNSYWFYVFFRSGQGDVTECMGVKTMQSNGIMAVGTTRYNPELAQVAREFLKRIGYVGIGGIEYKQCNGAYYFIEMSTRTEGFLPISDMAGVSIADAAFQYYRTGETPCKESRQRDSIRYISVLSAVAEVLRRKNVKTVMRALLLLLFSRKGYWVECFFRDGTYVRYIRQIIKQKME